MLSPQNQQARLCPGGCCSSHCLLATQFPDLNQTFIHLSASTPAPSCRLLTQWHHPTGLSALGLSKQTLARGSGPAGVPVGRSQVCPRLWAGITNSTTPTSMEPTTDAPALLGGTQRARREVGVGGQGKTRVELWRVEESLHGKAQSLPAGFDPRENKIWALFYDL